MMKMTTAMMAMVIVSIAATTCFRMDGLIFCELCNASEILLGKAWSSKTLCFERCKKLRKPTASGNLQRIRRMAILTGPFLGLGFLWLAKSSNSQPWLHNASHRDDPFDHWGTAGSQYQLDGLRAALRPLCTMFSTICPSRADSGSQRGDHRRRCAECLGESFEERLGQLCFDSWDCYSEGQNL